MLERVKQLWDENGVTGLMSGIGRYVYWNSGIQKRHHQIQYRLCGNTLTHNINGITAEFSVSNVTEYTRNKTLHGEKEILSEVLQSLEPEDIFFDVGANVGTYSCFADKVVSDGHVVAFEPHPVNIPRLKKNIELNESKISVFELALSSEIGTHSLTGDKNDQAGVGSSSLATSDDGPRIEVNVTTGDKLVSGEKVPHPSILKIDIEGAENRALSGMSEILESNYCHTVFCEVHPSKLNKYGDSERDVLEQLKTAGFNIEKLRERSSEYFIKATK